jgi:hypothetical protein
MRKLIVFNLSVAMVAISCNTTSLPPSTITTSDLMFELDLNSDGSISRSEAKGFVSYDFDKIDFDKNGRLDSAELEKFDNNKNNDLL